MLRKLVLHLLDRCYGRGSTGRHLRRRSGEGEELADHVQRDIGASGQQQERCDGNADYTVRPIPEMAEAVT